MKLPLLRVESEDSGQQFVSQQVFPLRVDELDVREEDGGHEALEVVAQRDQEAGTDPAAEADGDHLAHQSMQC